MTTLNDVLDVLEDATRSGDLRWHMRKEREVKGERYLVTCESSIVGVERFRIGAPGHIYITDGISGELVQLGGNGRVESLLEEIADDLGYPKRKSRQEEALENALKHLKAFKRKHQSHIIDH